MDIFKQLMRDEDTERDKDGFHIAYKCSSGAWTIGYGHNFDANPIAGVTKSTRLTEDQAVRILRDDVTKITSKLFRNMPWMLKLDDARKGVFINMAFNMGVNGLLKFKKTLKLAQEGDYTKASVEMLNSDWTDQVGDGVGGCFDRAERLSKQMDTGVWQ